MDKIEHKSKDELAEELRKLVVDLPANRPRCALVTTLHLANSGILNLAAVFKCPETRMVYRGFSVITLPRFYHTPNILGHCGGVEPSQIRC